MAAGAASRVLGWLVAHEEEMIELLERLARAESPSVDPRTQDEPFQLLAAELGQLDFVVRRVRGHGATGDHLYARPRRRRRSDARQLLIGHMDTVWPVGTLAEMPVHREGGLLYGPGTADMKGGLVEIVFALRALRELGLAPAATPVVLVNSDEEIGSPTSTPTIRRLAQGAVRAYVLESGEGPDGKLKIARKGIGNFTLTVRGRPTHAGTDFEHGVSAILELSTQVQRLFALNDPGRGITVNVGTIDGGLRPNVVAPVATAVVDVRVPSAEAEREVAQALQRIEPQLEGATVEIDGSFRRPPMEPLPRNRALLAAARRLGSALDIAVEAAELAGGGSDANTTSLYTGTLDGLGPIAEGSHATNEHVDVARLPERTALLALLLLEPLDHPQIARGRVRLGRSRSAPTRAPVALLGTEASGTNAEIVAAWNALGIDATLIAPSATAVQLRRGTTVIGRLDVLPTLDGVEPGLRALLRLEQRGVHVLNRAAALTAAHDKLITARLLAAAGLPHPRTTHLHRRNSVCELEPPVVVKPRFGSWGLDVFRCNTQQELARCLEEIRTRPWFRRHGALVQELLPPVGHDLRILVADGTVVGCVRRLAVPGDWRTNISLGGTRQPTVPPPDAALLALRAAAAIQADLVGVDLLPCEDGFTILELNGSPDFNDTYSLPGRDVFRDAAAALGFLVDHARDAVSSGHPNMPRLNGSAVTRSCGAASR
jgi:glutamate carboxypeptidase